MSREIHLMMEEADVVTKCASEKVAISALERLPQGGVRLVCMSSDGAGKIRKKLKAKLIQGPVIRERFRPTRPLW